MGRRPHQVQIQPCCRPSAVSGCSLTEGCLSFLLCNVETATVPPRGLLWGTEVHVCEVPEPCLAQGHSVLMAMVIPPGNCSGFPGWPLAHRFGLSPSHILLSFPFLTHPLPQPSVPCPFFTVKAKGSPFTQTFQGPPCVETTPPAPFTVCLPQH